MTSDDDEDIDLEEWMDLTDEQQDAMLDREMAELQRNLDAMTVPQQVAHHRHFALESIMANRDRLRRLDLRNMSFIENHFRESIKRTQLLLLKLRIWRATGTYPGSS